MKKNLKKVVFFGDSGVGKTCIIKRFIYPNVEFIDDAHHATVGVDFLSRGLDFQDRNVNLQVWDNAGKEEIKDFGLTFCRGADLIVLTFDVTNTASFEKLREFYDSLSSKQSLMSTHFLILGNKTDINDKRVISAKRGREFAQSINVDYAEMSAKNTNIDAIESIFKKALIKAEQRKNEPQEFMSESSIDDKPDHLVNVRNYQAILAKLKDCPRRFNDNKMGVVKAKHLEELLSVSQQQIKSTIDGVLRNSEHELLENRSKLGPFFFKAKSWFLGHHNPLLDRLCESETEWRLVEAYTAMN